NSRNCSLCTNIFAFQKVNELSIQLINNHSHADFPIGGVAVFLISCDALNNPVSLTIIVVDVFNNRNTIGNQTLNFSLRQNLFKRNQVEVIHCHRVSSILTRQTTSNHSGQEIRRQSFRSNSNITDNSRITKNRTLAVQINSAGNDLINSFVQISSQNSHHIVLFILRLTFNILKSFSMNSFIPSQWNKEICSSSKNFSKFIRPRNGNRSVIPASKI